MPDPSNQSHSQPVIVLTGGGTAGHVMPNLALVPYLQESGFRIVYVGSKGIEKEIVTAAGLEFETIQSGKLRRYASIENFKDVFKVLIGTVQAYFALGRIRPACVFSKGGFVAVPVAVAAWVRGIPVISHESDVSPGLANRIISRFAKMNLYAFPETGRYMAGRPSRLVGTPVRQAILGGDRLRGLKFCRLEASEAPAAPAANDSPVILFMGGSQGAKFINDLVTASLKELLAFARVVHLTGRGKQSSGHQSNTFDLPGSQERYRSFEFIGDELPDVLAAADLVISRAGANSIFELRAISKQMILIPLEKGSRGDQVLNAQSFQQNGWAQVLREAEASPQSLVSLIHMVLSSKEQSNSAMQPTVSLVDHPVEAILSEIRSVIKDQR